jgi:hypothetical protein
MSNDITLDSELSFVGTGKLNNGKTIEVNFKTNKFNMERDYLFSPRIVIHPLLNKDTKAFLQISEIEDKSDKEESNMKEAIYSTGEMIDVLQIGDKAETENGKYQATKTEYGMVVIKNEHGNVGLNEIVLTSKWRIIPKEVTFEEAKLALRVGKVIQCMMPVSRRITRYIPNGNVISYAGEPITWEQIFRGIWTIEN